MRARVDRSGHLLHKGKGTYDLRHEYKATASFCHSFTPNPQLHRGHWWEARFSTLLVFLTTSDQDRVLHPERAKRHSICVE